MLACIPVAKETIKWQKSFYTAKQLFLHAI